MRTGKKKEKKKKERLDTLQKYKRNQVLGIVKSQRTQKHGNV